jgi:hypothetical protein
LRNNTVGHDVADSDHNLLAAVDCFLNALLAYQTATLKMDRAIAQFRNHNHAMFEQAQFVGEAAGAIPSIRKR